MPGRVPPGSSDAAILPLKRIPDILDVFSSLVVLAAATYTVTYLCESHFSQFAAMLGCDMYHARSFWMVGSIFAGTAAWVLLGDDFGGRRIVPGASWRHYALVAAIPAASALLLTYCFVPESPRFLAKAGRLTFKANGVKYWLR